MWCEKQFAAFNENLKVDDTRQGRILSAVGRFVDFTKCEEQLKLARAADPFLQGSVPTRTVIRPLASDEFDVDVVFPFKLSVFKPEHQNPASIFEWFVTRLQTSEFYRKSMERKNRCVRIHYAGDFHVDLIPSTQELVQHHPFAVPARDLKDWITSDPVGFMNWVLSVDRLSGVQDAAGDGVFRRCVRYMKRWRDSFGEESFAPSVLLVTILGKHEASNPNRYNPPIDSPLYPTYKKDAAYLHDLLRLTVSCIRQANHGAFLHPTIPGEDLAAGCSQADLDRLISRLTACMTNVGNAIAADTESKAVEFYRKALGGTFPA